MKSFSEWEHLTEYERGYVRGLKDMSTRYCRRFGKMQAIPLGIIKRELKKLDEFVRNRRLGNIGTDIEHKNPKVMGRVDPTKIQQKDIRNGKDKGM